ncbi:hypothetical protein ASZ78_013406 [Callipepla squamata]|uniref:RGS domain-containing protein n=1 Tax=Callipepla squamata TaxID=9009 RepID=A0A226MMF4_CALSU|nr:hypothetical protein ASZ78_013406 [Callipepla squamata]
MTMFTRNVNSVSNPHAIIIYAKDHDAIFKDRCCFHRSNTEETLAWSDSVDTLLANKDLSIRVKLTVPPSLLQINIDFHTRNHISQNISEPTLSCFDDAQRLIYSLMAKDSFPRFLRSKEYKELAKKQENRNEKRWLPFL